MDQFEAITYTTPEYVRGEETLTTMSARAFTPDKEAYEKPENGYALIVWLHGIGEVGTDNRIQIAANNVPRWAEKDSQDIFGGAYVLAPQNHANFGQGNGPAATMSLIQQFVAAKGDIDPNRIYIGGCSYGGMSTWAMIREYPNYFAAAFPVCGGPVGGLSKADIEELKDLPIYITTAAGDSTVRADGMIQAYNDLTAAGAENVHITLFEHVDSVGLDGLVAAIGHVLDHFSWIYVHDNYDAKGDDYDGRNFIDTNVDAEYKDFVAGSSAVVKDGKLTFTYKPTEDSDPVSITLEGPSERPEDAGYETFKHWLADQKKVDKPAPTHKFIDVPADEWYADAVEYVYQKGLIRGVTSTTFCPTVATDRSMIVTVLYRLEKETAQSAAGSSFSDVPANAWYAEALQWAAENKLVKGYSDGTFRPKKEISREEMITILYKYAAYKGRDVSATADLSKFTDSDQISEFARPAIEWAVATGIISGTGNNMLSPKESVQRSHFAEVLMSYCEKLGK